MADALVDPARPQANVREEHTHHADHPAVAGLASTRTYPLRSSFKPSYNMAVNLVRQVGRETARELLESSFAQFQADKAVVGLVARRDRCAKVPPSRHPVGGT